MATDPAKETIYVDVDDEITAIIDKMNTAQAKIVALVLPKRASMFQSIVNMKLLKRRADKAGKRVVLITSEASLLPLAGLAGLYVASTLQSKPHIPDAPDTAAATHPTEQSAELPDEPGAKPAAAGAAAGQVAGGAKPRVFAPAGVSNSNGDIELDNTDSGAKTAAGGAAAAAAAKKSKRGGHDAVQRPGKGFAVPDFFKFRKRLLLIGLGLILLVVAYIVMYRVLPTGSVVIATRTDDINTSLDMTLDTNADKLNEADKVVPATLQQQQKSYTQQAPATGQRNDGAKAAGNVRITNCVKSDEPVTIPAGTGVSANGLTYLTQSSLTLDSANFTSSGKCRDDRNAEVRVVASQAGAQYNTGEVNMTVAGPSGLKARVDDKLDGGTDQITKIVQQSDIDAAKAKLNIDSDKAPMQKQLQSALENSDLYAIQDSFTAAPGNSNITVQAGQPGDSVTVSETINYAMYGVKRSDLSKLVKNEANEQIDESKQSVLDDGVNGADFKVGTPGSGQQLRVGVSAVVTAGPNLDIESLPTRLAGKKGGDVKSELGSTPGVEDIEVKYSPFWVKRLPSNPDKITVNFRKAGNE